jgi:nitroimidazol reductase NimA-like FMN-containing flavoprotein (pyridoxamine 5'-phosphate oxidase superfamily)
MLDTAARAFLQKTLIARLSTLGTDGYPHNVPIWFLAEGDDILFISDRGVRKTQNALRYPKGAVVIGGDHGDGGGYMLQGDLQVEEDPYQIITHRMIDRYEKPEQAAELKEAWKHDDVIVIRLKPVKVIKV